MAAPPAPNPTAAPAPVPATPPAAPNGNGQRRRALLILAIVLLVCGGTYGLYSLWWSWHYESTDDAFIEGTVVQVSPQVSGHVVRVLVDDNQHVAAGQLLIEIEPDDYRDRVQQARGALDSAKAQRAAAEADLATITKTARASVKEQQGAVDAAGFALESARCGAAAAESSRDQAKAHADAARAGAEQAVAEATAAQAEADRAAADFTRYQSIFKTGGITASQLDQYAAAAKSSAAALEAARRRVAAAEAQGREAGAGVQTAEESLLLAQADIKQAAGKLEESRGKLAGVSTVDEKIAKATAERDRAVADVAQLGAALAQAELDLSYTKVFAAQAGTVTRKSVEVGNYVRPGQALMAVVADDKWVVANFKETQLAHMQPGQQVKISIDAYPSLKLTGKIDSVQRGTGARFSLLPAENATGNYVKVVQRVPVKIVFDGPAPADVPLSLGLSVIPTVRVR
jgi:membrane fusion protein (multidrug efflux system)